MTVTRSDRKTVVDMDVESWTLWLVVLLVLAEAEALVVVVVEL